MTEPFFDGLTEAQTVAVRHVDGPLLILAGAGSGKTRVVTSRMAHLISSGIRSTNILGLTFTNKAADEMRRRLANMVPLDAISLSTFHRFCSQLLRYHAALVGLTENFSIFDTQDSLAVLKSAIEGSDLTTSHYTPVQLARVISNAKNELLGPEEYTNRTRSPLSTIAADVYPLYQQRLLASNAVDFDDLLLYTAKLLYENSELRHQLDDRFRYVLVDEYQDTNLAQYRIVRALSVDFPNLAVTGDPDQSIYGWRGANVRNILDFEKDYPDATTVILEKNYRSTPNILCVANELISHNQYRKRKSLFTEAPAGTPVRLVNYSTSEEEARQIVTRIAEFIREEKYHAKDIAILYRTNALSRMFEHAFRVEGIPYQIVNGVEFYKRKEIKDVLAYLHLVNNPQNDMAFLRVINTPARGIGRKTLQQVEEFARSNHCSLLSAIKVDVLIESLSARPRKAVRKFREDFSVIYSAATSMVEELVGLVLSTTDFAEQFIVSGTEEDEQRLANIQELLTASREYDQMNPDGTGLDGFLEQTALVNDTDDWEFEGDKITLMTLHSAKGMEFPVVFIVAVEHGIVPHERARDDPMSLEEERRLLFVGVTRAQRELQISYVTHRDYRGTMRRAIPSQFATELPVQEMECLSSQPASYPRQDDAWYQTTEEDCIQGEYDEEYTQVDMQSSQRKTTSPGPTEGSTRRFMTAAEMLTDVASRTPARTEPVSPEIFELGMLVDHPDYGPGKMIALSGTRDQRTATVQFLSPPQRKKFRLAHSHLRPISSP